MNNIYPVYSKLTTREVKEDILKQHSVSVWMYGLSGAGKTTVAIELEKLLSKNSYICQVLDADNIRHKLNKDLGFSIEDRTENIRRVSELNNIFLDSGIITLNCFISPTNDIREMARNMIGSNDFVEVFFNAPLEVCLERDPKGLYKKAVDGSISNFTGISSPFETPENPDLELRTDILTIEECVNKVYEFILPKIKY